MKKALLPMVLAMVFAMLACAPMYAAKQYKHKKPSSSSSCSSSSKSCAVPMFPNTSPKDTTDPVILTCSYQKIPFSQTQLIGTKFIQTINDTDFLLAQGRYLVTFSDVETVTELTSVPVYIDYALSVGGFQVIEFTDSSNVFYNPTVTKSFSLIVTVVRPSILNVQARLDPTLNTACSEYAATINQRMLTITRISSTNK